MTYSKFSFLENIENIKNIRNVMFLNNYRGCDASAVFAVMQCPSVRLSRSWITSKRINVATPFFSTPKGVATFRRQPPNGGVECKRV